MNYYKVVAIQGHLGAGKGSTITFAVEADSIYDAMQIGRKMPMVKHNHPKAIQSVELITKEEYDELRKQSAYYRNKK